MSTKTETETETNTSTVTRTQGACAIGAGAAAITCKAMVLGFLASGLALAGLSGIGSFWLMTGVLVIGGALVWKGFRWAGRRPALIGLSALVTMWLGYVAAGYFVTGRLFTSTNFGMMPAESILQNPIGLIPVALLYISGTVLFFGAVYDSFIREMDMSDGRGGMAAGLAGASVCGGCGLTGLAGAAMVLLTGASATNATKFVGANLMMFVTLVGIVAFTLYARQLKQTVLALVGGVVTFFLTEAVFGFPAEGGFLGLLGVTLPSEQGEMLLGLGANIWGMVGVMFEWVGLGIMFFALVWAFNPQMRVIPQDWKPSRATGEAS
jgi:hypothetical protein